MTPEEKTSLDDLGTESKSLHELTNRLYRAVVNNPPTPAPRPMTSRSWASLLRDVPLAPVPASR